MNFKNLVLVTILLAFIYVTEAHSTDFNLNVSGMKKFGLNEQVAPSQLNFTSQAPLEDIKGNVETDKIASSVNMDPANIESMTGKVSFQVKGMETGIKNRDGHLVSNEWLDANLYPEITFDLQKITDVKIDQVDKDKGRSYASAVAHGIFKMHGKSKNIAVPVKITYVKESDKTQKRAPGDFLSVEGSFDIALKDFDVRGTSGLIGKKVGETINADFKLFYNSK